MTTADVVTPHPHTAGMFTFPCADADCTPVGSRPYARWKEPSVTKIVGVQDKGMPFAWSASKIAATYYRNHAAELARLDDETAIDKARKAFSAEWSTSAAVGSAIHACGESFLRGEMWTPPADMSDELCDRVVGFVEGLYAFFNDCTPVAIATEQIVRGTTPNGITFLGTFDWLCTINDEVWLLDLKTGKARDGLYMNENRVQLAAYRWASELLHIHKTKEVASLPLWDTLPAPTRTGIIKMSGAGDYQLYDVDSGPEVFEVFGQLAAVEAWISKGHTSPAPVVVAEHHEPEPEAIVYEPRVDAPVSEGILG